MPERSNGDFKFKTTPKVEIGNPSLWDKLIKPFVKASFQAREVIVKSEDIIDLAETRIEGRTVFVAIGASAQDTNPRREDPISGLIEILVESLHKQDWGSVELIGNSLLKDFRGRPGGMHLAALDSPHIGTLHDTLMTASGLCRNLEDNLAVHLILRQSIQDLAIDCPAA